MNIIAIDLGDKRTGIAIANDAIKIAQPLCVIEIPIGNKLIKKIQSIIIDHDADALVVGLPLNMDGTEGHRSKITKEFVNNLKKNTKLNIYLQDERLTSISAEEKLHQSGRTHKQKKKIRDAIAAAEILKDFLDSMEMEK